MRVNTVRRWLAPALVIGGGAAAFALTAAAAIETHDPFCAACHLPPEVTFVERAAALRAVDLAAAHAQVAGASRDAATGDGGAASGDGADPAGEGDGPADPVRCVDCHGGRGLRGRAHGLAIGARDAWAWVRGDFVVVGTDYQPLGRLEHPIDDAVCTACHTETLAAPGFANHFHHALAEPEAPPALTCVTCHAAHRPRPGDRAFLDLEDAAPGCDMCHDAMGGPSSVLGRR